MIRALAGHKWGPYLALGFGLAMIGLSAILIRLAGTPGIVAAFYRMSIAVLVVAPVFGLQARRRGSKLLSLAGPALLGGVLFAADLAAWSTGVVLSGATNPTLMANTAPVWVGLGAWLLFRERQPRLFWIGLTLAMSGAVLVLGHDSLKSLDLGAGTLLGLLAGVFYGGYFLATERGRVRLDSISYFWLSGITTSVLLAGMAVALGQPLTGYSTRSYLYLALLALGPQTLGWLAINFAQGHLPASVVAPTLLGQPVATALLAGPILGEQVSPLEAVGGLIVLSGVYLVHRGRLRGGRAESGGPSAKRASSRNAWSAEPPDKPDL